VQSVFTYALWAGVVQAVLALSVLSLGPWELERAIWPLLVALLAGVVRALALIAQYKGIHEEEEVSRAVPIIDGYPVFVAILAVVFLGQSLTLTRWLAIAMVVAGAILVSQHNLLPGHGMRLGKSFLYLLSGSLGIAVFVILVKVSLAELSFWHVYALSSLGGALLLIAAALASGAGTETSSLLKRPQALAPIILGEVLLAFSMVTSFVAFNIGPVSLVSAITATRPLMVLLYSASLSFLVPRILSERLYPKELAQKLLAAGMVVVGIATMGLGR
jgi:uncharacterized membrane protein